MMHAFWEHWDGFPMPCDEMNIYTFRRDLAQFILMFRFFDRLLEQNPWEDWRPYYNNLIAEFTRYSGPDGENGWQLLADVYEEGGHFRADIWNLLYHAADTDLPMLVSGKVHLIPPPLRPYFKGYIHPVQEADQTPWRDDLVLYSALTREDLRLMDFASRELIGSLAGISEIQRAALLEVLMVREREHGPCYAWAYTDGNSHPAVRGIENTLYTKDVLRPHLDTLKSEMHCGSTALYEKPPLDLSKAPCQP